MSDEKLTHKFFTKALKEKLLEVKQDVVNMGSFVSHFILGDLQGDPPALDVHVVEGIDAEEKIS